VLGSAARCRPQPGLAVQAPWEPQRCRQGAGEEAGSCLDGPWSRGEVCGEGGPEVRTLGGGGGLPEGFKEETSSFTASFRVPGECLWIQVPAALVGGVGGMGVE